MNGMAKSIWYGLERSNMFIDLFSSGLADDDWHQKPNGVTNPAIWILGHLAYQRAEFLRLITGQKTYDAAWVPLFQVGCEPHDSHKYPDVEISRKFLADRLEDFKTYLETVTEEELEAAPKLASNYFKTKIGALVHMTHHEAHHTGQLSMIRRMLGKEKII